MRGIPLAPSRIIVIPFHWMTACQHHSDVVLQSHGTCLVRSVRSKTTCLLGFFSTRIWLGCATSWTVTRRAFLLVYCRRVFSFRFFFWISGLAVVTAGCIGGDVGGCCEVEYWNRCLRHWVIRLKWRSKTASSEAEKMVIRSLTWSAERPGIWLADVMMNDRIV